MNIDEIREELIIDRIVYYCLNENLKCDYDYDKLESTLKRMVANNPELESQGKYHEWCPASIVGSCNVKDYPKELVKIAKRKVKNLH